VPPRAARLTTENFHTELWELRCEAKLFAYCGVIAQPTSRCAFALMPLKAVEEFVSASTRATSGLQARFIGLVSATI
jgi:hypothetical protein